MFGFMRTRSCQRHYCGVCKTIGATYGQAPRLLLNHDTVLIAEIMTALSPAATSHPVLKRRGCFRLPDPETVPLPLRFAAATTMLLAGAKVRDHVADTGRTTWRLLARAFQPRYEKAGADLAAWGLPVAQIETQLASQSAREANPVSLAELSNPTAFATAQVCGTAAKLSGRADAEPALMSFGQNFGHLIYVLDAWHDYAKDTASGQFNAIRALFQSRESARQEITTAASAVAASIDALPLDDRPREALKARFQASLTFSMEPAKAVKKTFADRLPDWAPDWCDSCCCDECCCLDSCCDSCDCGDCCSGCDC
jgi:hypothetical protein